jgi:hypothetical protein
MRSALYQFSIRFETSECVPSIGRFKVVGVNTFPSVAPWDNPMGETKPRRRNAVYRARPVK